MVLCVEEAIGGFHRCEAKNGYIAIIVKLKVAIWCATTVRVEEDG
jgi:hypothetical protein